MQLISTPFVDAYLIDPKKFQDERGCFSRLFCASSFKEKGLEETFIQTNLSSNPYKGTLRGMHYQKGPMEEVKLVRCLQGTIWDCIVDVRKESPTYLQHYGVELSAKNGLLLYVPKGFAHSFITLEDHCEVLYQVSTAYSPSHEAGLRWNDPKLGIQWPITPTLVSSKDQNHPLA